MPTVDWNIVAHAIDPLVVPFHVTNNTFFGVLLVELSLSKCTGRMPITPATFPINTNTMDNHFGNAYNVSTILDEHEWLNEVKYQAY